MDLKGKKDKSRISFASSYTMQMTADEWEENEGVVIDTKFADPANDPETKAIVRSLKN